MNPDCVSNNHCIYGRCNTFPLSGAARLYRINIKAGVLKEAYPYNSGYRCDCCDSYCCGNTARTETSNHVRCSGVHI